MLAPPNVEVCLSMAQLVVSFCRFSVGLFASLLSIGTAHAIDKNYSFSVVPQVSGKEHVLVAKNDGPAPVSAQIIFTELDNAASSLGATFKVVVPAGTERQIARVHGMAPKGEYSFRFNYRWRLGDPSAEHYDNALYRLPFGQGLSFSIAQGPGGHLSTHADGGQEWAIDLPMPIGTPIVAARSGYVVEAVGEHGEGGPDAALMNKTNYVRIMHDDGTFATYAHLLRDSVRVSIGQRVAEGGLLGLSGNSGYSSGPHLHFAVERFDGLSTVSVPFRFYNARGVFAPAFGLRVMSNYPASQIAAETPATAVGGVRQDN